MSTTTTGASKHLRNQAEAVGQSIQLLEVRENVLMKDLSDLQDLIANRRKEAASLVAGAEALERAQ